MSDTKIKRIWDNFVEVSEVQKSDKIKFVISAAVRDGVKYINIREFYLRQKDGVWKPGRDGITIPIALPINNGNSIIQPFKNFSAALVQTVKVLKDLPLYDENNVVTKEVKK